MSEALFGQTSAVEYFKDLVDGALARQRVDAGELTTFYVVQLLTNFLQRPAAEDDEPLALKLVRALDSAGPRQRSGLKEVGDVSLFISGFFADSLKRKIVDVDYYAAIGGYAYATLSRYETDTFSPAFAELARRFVEFADVLGEVSERTSCTSNADLLRVYEKWLKTGSRHSGRLLVERGVVPTVPKPNGRVQ